MTLDFESKRVGVSRLVACKQRDAGMVDLDLKGDASLRLAVEFRRKLDPAGSDRATIDSHFDLRGAPFGKRVYGEWDFDPRFIDLQISSACR